MQNSLKLVKKIFTLLFILIPASSFSQNAGDIIEENTVVADTSTQTDLLDLAKSLFKIKPKTLEEEKNKKVYFSIIPTSAEIPGGGNALITTTTAGFYLGDRDKTYL